MQGWIRQFSEVSDHQQLQVRCRMQMRHQTRLCLTLLVVGAAHAQNCHDWPRTCPGTFPKMPPTWQMNLSTIIMPCNDTGYTDPQSTLGWAIVDFDWSNGKGTGTTDGWVKHKPMDDEEMLFKQVKMTTAATPGTTVWVWLCHAQCSTWRRFTGTPSTGTLGIHLCAGFSRTQRTRAGGLNSNLTARGSPTSATPQTPPSAATCTTVRSSPQDIHMATATAPPRGVTAGACPADSIFGITQAQCWCTGKAFKIGSCMTMY